MSPDRIKISKEFHINGEGLWLTEERPIAENEDPLEEFKKGYAGLIKTFQTLTGGDYSAIPGHPMYKEPDKINYKELERSREEIIAAHLITINECKTLRNLEMFANMVQRENDQSLFDAYNKKKKEFQ
jgi:hypothetical protein